MYLSTTKEKQMYIFSSELRDYFSEGNWAKWLVLLLSSFFLPFLSSPTEGPVITQYSHSCHTKGREQLLPQRRKHILCRIKKACALFIKNCILQLKHNLQMEQLIWLFWWLLKSLYYIKLSPVGLIFQCCYNHQPFLLRRSIGTIWSLVNHCLAIFVIYNVTLFTHLKNYKPEHTLYIKQINQLL